jgi:hypothetical protein
VKNYKPKVRYLEDYQVKALNNLGFYTPYISHKKEINKNTSDFQKNYGMCGGGFTLKINLQYYCFGDTHYKPYVKIKTPYDSWWSSLWEVNAFTEEIREFQEELNRDIGALIALGIIEEDKDKGLNIEVYIIQTIDEEEYHSGGGNMSDRLQDAEFYADEKLAERMLSTFDEPDEFEIKKILVNLSFDREE